MERTAGVEPAPAGWKPAALPLGHVRVMYPRAVKGNRTPIASLAASRSTIELPPQVKRERTAGVEPAWAGWDPAVLTVRPCPRFGGPPRESCTRDLHSPSPAYQAGAPLSGPEQQKRRRASGGTGRSRTDYILNAGQVLSQLSYDPRVRGAGRPRAIPRPPPLGGESADEQSGVRGVCFADVNPRNPARPGGATGSRTPIPTLRR